MQVKFEGTVELSLEQINEAIADYVKKHTGHTIKKISPMISHYYDQLDRGPGTPYLKSIRADIDFTALPVGIKE